MHAIVSIHDVSPITLPRVKALVEQLPAPCREGLTLLIIPGRHWQAGDIQTLKHWQTEGYHLAGHGWKHHCEQVRGWYHRLHSLILSRDAAEHLSLEPADLQQLLTSNAQWFNQQGLHQPEIYVPPAWAMGRLKREDLQALPFRYYETTGGIYDAEQDRFITLPLIGFEADNYARQISLGAWNRLNVWASSRHRPLRISIHPRDNELLLRRQMDQLLKRVSQGHSYQSLFRGPAVTTSTE